MFWDNRKDDAPIIHFESHNQRTSYRVDLQEEGLANLLIGSDRVKIDNLSATGVAFRLPDDIQPSLISGQRFHGILYIGQQQNPIPVELSIVARERGVMRCQFEHHDLIAQKRLTAAIVDYQKYQIRARSGELE